MHNPENERIKRAYFFYLKEARRLGEHSVDSAAAALAKFEDYNKFRDFKRFHIQQAIGFKRMLSDQISPRTGERLSRGTVFSTLNALRGFFLWLATQPGYRSHLTPADAEYFSLSDKEARIAKAALDRPVPTIEQIRHVLKGMPAVTDVELRNRAVVAFTLLTGARDGAIASLKLKHVDVLGNRVEQDARECTPSSPRPSRHGSSRSGTTFARLLWIGSNTLPQRSYTDPWIHCFRLHRSSKTETTSSKWAACRISIGRMPRPSG
jgi:site-specific recombinase XerD